MLDSYHLSATRIEITLIFFCYKNIVRLLVLVNDMPIQGNTSSFRANSVTDHDLNYNTKKVEYSGWLSNGFLF